MALTKFDLATWAGSEASFAARVPAKLLRGLLTRSVTVPTGTAVLAIGTDGSRRTSLPGESVALDAAADLIFVRTVPADLVFHHGNLLSKDVTLLDLSLRLTVQAGRHEAELLAVADKLLQREEPADKSQLRRVLQPAVADAVRTYCSERPLSEIMAPSLRTSLAEAIRTQCARAAFEAGVELHEVDQVSVDCEAYREQVAAEQRNRKAIADLRLGEEIEERRHEGRVAQVERLERLAGRLGALRAQHPDLPLAGLLGQVEEGQRGEFYEAMLGLCPDAEPCRALLVAAGRSVLVFEPPAFDKPVRTIYVPPQLGSVRSVRVLDCIPPRRKSDGDSFGRSRGMQIPGAAPPASVDGGSKVGPAANQARSGLITHSILGPAAEGSKLGTDSKLRLDGGTGAGTGAAAGGVADAGSKSGIIARPAAGANGGAPAGAGDSSRIRAAAAAAAIPTADAGAGPGAAQERPSGKVVVNPFAASGQAAGGNGASGGAGGPSDPPSRAMMLLPSPTGHIPSDQGAVEPAAGPRVPQDLVVGCQYGVYILPGDGSPPREYPLSGSARKRTLKGGINSVCVSNGRLFASHSEVGLSTWRVDRPGREGALVRPAMAAPSAVRSCCSDHLGRVLVSWDSVVLRLDPGRLDPAAHDPGRADGEELDARNACDVFGGSSSEITCVMVVEGAVFAGNAEGHLLRWDSESPTAVPVVVDRSTHKIYSVAGAMLGNLRRVLIADNSFGIRTRVCDDTGGLQAMESRYRLPQSPVCFLAGSSDFLFGVDNGQGHVFVWHSRSPETPVVDIPVRRITQHSVKDIAVLTGAPGSGSAGSKKAAPAATSSAASSTQPAPRRSASPATGPDATFPQPAQTSAQTSAQTPSPTSSQPLGRPAVFAPTAGRPLDPDATRPATTASVGAADAGAESVAESVAEGGDAGLTAGETGADRAAMLSMELPKIDRALLTVPAGSPGVGDSGQ